METTRTSSLCSSLFLAAALVCGCGGGALETATELPKTPRRPDGVVLEPPPVLPAAADRAPASGVVALLEPLADKDIEDVVRAYVRAFEREDSDSLVRLLAQEAAPLGRGGGRTQLIELWRTKMKNFEYQKLAGVEIARISLIEKHTFETLAVPGGIPRPSEMRQGDLYVRVPIATPRLGSDQLFGDILVLLLRREDGRLKIAGQADENAP
ncbi:MAG: hypothetical protein JST00_23210 [Deltaproteobacteria bacterium]|nr:hypothetical protein [Deltaproteobacteria bacterium]